MAKLFRFDKSRRTSWRSYELMPRIAAKTARAIKRDKAAKQKLDWKIPAAVFVLVFLIVLFAPLP